MTGLFDHRHLHRFVRSHTGSGHAPLSFVGRPATGGARDARAADGSAGEGHTSRQPRATALMRPETGQALLAEVSQLARGADSPPLSVLVERPVKERPVAAAARETLELVPDVTPLRRVPSSSVPAHRLTAELRSGERTAAPLRAQSCVAVLGAHGGAGVSSLLRAGLTAAGGIDAGGTWPVAEPVLLVARTSTSGLEQVQNLVREHAEGLAGGACELLGLVLVADAPGRLPRRVSELADLVSGGFTRVWQIPWLEEWRLAAASEPLPVHPDVARLHAELQSLVGVERRRAC